MESGSILLPTLIIVSVVCSSRRILRIIMWVLGLHPSYFLAKHGMCRRCIIIILFSSEEWHISRPCIPHLLQTLIWWIVLLNMVGALLCLVVVLGRRFRVLVPTTHHTPHTHTHIIISYTPLFMAALPPLSSAVLQPPPLSTVEFVQCDLGGFMHL